MSEEDPGKSKPTRPGEVVGVVMTTVRSVLEFGLRGSTFEIDIFGFSRAISQNTNLTKKLSPEVIEPIAECSNHATTITSTTKQTSVNSHLSGLDLNDPNKGSIYGQSTDHNKELDTESTETSAETNKRESTTANTTEIGGLPISKVKPLPQILLNSEVFSLDLNDPNKNTIGEQSTDLNKELNTENTEVSAEPVKSPPEEVPEGTEAATEEAPEETPEKQADEGGGEEARKVAAESGAALKYTIKRVQIKPGKTLRADQDPKNENYLVSLPVIPDKQAPYVPMPYTFRLPSASKPTKINNLLARCPPFYLLLDHAISVIWLLFAEKEYECPLGIVQLQWALVFLKTIHTRQGEPPKDVELCINAIENILLDQYAELAKDSSTLERLDGNVHYMDGAFGSNTMVTQSFPFSLNYAEMITKYQGSDVSESGSKATITSAEAEEQLENIKLAAGVASIEKLDSVSREKAINILKMWKSEQVEKIRGELKRLRSIEDRMKDIDDNFQGYIEDDIEMLYSG